MSWQSMGLSNSGLTGKTIPDVLNTDYSLVSFHRIRYTAHKIPFNNIVVNTLSEVAFDRLDLPNACNDKIIPMKLNGATGKRL